MIESLGEHGVLASDLVPALMTTHTVANPEYDPEEAKRIEEEAKLRPLSPGTLAEADDDDDDDEVEEQSISDQTLIDEPAISKSVSTTTPTFKFPEMNMTTPTQTPTAPSFPGQTLIVPSDTAASSGAPTPLMQVKSDTKVLKDSTAHSVPGVSTTLSAADKNVTLDIRWTVLCDLFLLLIADSVYDARSRVLLEQVAYKLGLGWLDVVKFESRVTEALEIQEDIETLEQKDLVEGARKAGNKRRYMMLGLATLGLLLLALGRINSDSLVRWWSGHWAVRWSYGSCYWIGSCGRVHDYWCDGYRSFLGRNRWCSCDHHRRSPHWFWYRCQRNGKKNPARPDIRNPSSA